MYKIIVLGLIFCASCAASRTDIIRVNDNHIRVLQYGSQDVSIESGILKANIKAPKSTIGGAIEVFNNSLNALFNKTTIEGNK